MTDISETTTRRHLALGRCQAFAHLRLETNAQLALAIRSAKACGASSEEIKVETGLTTAEVRRILTRPPNTLGAGA